MGSFYSFRNPSAALAGAVEMLWYYQGYDPPHTYERILPAGTVELVVNLTDEVLRTYHPETFVPTKMRGPILAGLHEEPIIVDTMQQTRMMGAGFRPGGAWQILGIPIAEFEGRHIELDCLQLQGVAQLEEQLYFASTSEKCFDLMEAWLLSHLNRSNHPEVSWAIEQIVLYPSTAKIAELAEETGLSARRLGELFKREVGVGPKSFAMIRRFQSVISDIQRDPSIDWCQLAISAGYADQAHFNREFRRFSGIRPTEYSQLCLRELGEVASGERDQICPIVAPGPSDFFNTSAS